MKFLIWWNNDTWYWTLHDGTHQLARSAGRYATEEECRAAIPEFRQQARTAPIDDRVQTGADPDPTQRWNQGVDLDSPED